MIKELINMMNNQEGINLIICVIILLIGFFLVIQNTRILLKLSEQKKEISVTSSVATQTSVQSLSIVNIKTISITPDDNKTTGLQDRRIIRVRFKTSPDMPGTPDTSDTPISTRSKRIYTCKICGEQGHNKTTCPTQT